MTGLHVIKIILGLALGIIKSRSKLEAGYTPRMKPQDTLIQGMIENEDSKNDIENISPMKQDENQTSVVLWRPRTNV